MPESKQDKVKTESNGRCVAVWQRYKIHVVFFSHLFGLNDNNKTMDGIEKIIGSSFLGFDQTGQTQVFQYADNEPAEYWLLYFSAKWCKFCKKVAPKLVDFYQNAPGAIEVLFVSADRTQEEYDAYTKGMPWLRIDYKDQARIKRLASIFHVDGIPEIVVLNRQGRPVHLKAVDKLLKDSKGVDFPWTA